MGDTTERKTRMTLVSDIPEGKIMTLMGDIPDNNTSVMGDTPERKTDDTKGDIPEGKIMTSMSDIPDYDDISMSWETHL